VVGRLWSQYTSEKNVRPHLKINLEAKKAECVAQVAKHLPSTCKALNSNPRASPNKDLLQKFIIFLIYPKGYSYQDIYQFIGSFSWSSPETHTNKKNQKSPKGTYAHSAEALENEQQPLWKRHKT
jgi:hypothetical protein